MYKDPKMASVKKHANEVISVVIWCALCIKIDTFIDIVLYSPRKIGMLLW